MKQLVQDNRSGEIVLAEVPAPHPGPHDLLVQTHASVISVGTEKSMLDFAQKSLLGKGLARPDLVRLVIDRARTEGISNVWREASAHLDTPFPLGYSSMGRVLACGKEVAGWRGGQRVACGSTFFASHAEVVAVPWTLCAPVPEAVADEEAAFAFLGAIALHGIRTSEITPGENVAVIGAGLLGQIAVQILKSFGCSVLAIDVMADRMALAGELGADAVSSPDRADALSAAGQLSGGLVDCVLIYASAPGPEPLELAAELCRDRGTIVLIGNVPVAVPRKVLYEKELRLRVSRSAGPGIYNPAYEAGQSDLEVAYVRWSAGRNMAYFLELLSRQRIRLRPLITHTFSLDNALDAYRLLTNGTPCLGMVIKYGLAEVPLGRRVEISPSRGVERTTPGMITIGAIGAGQFARGTLLPLLAKVPQARLGGVAARTGLSARHAADRFRFAYATTEYEQLLADDSIDAVAITTRHNLHAPLVCAARAAGKAVFVEKPLAITRDQLRDIIRAYATPAPRHLADVLVVGFNRRYSPTARAVKEFLAGKSGPLSVLVRVNAGSIVASHWTQDLSVGGGRIIGEVCHFIDLVQFFTDASPVRVMTDQVSADDDITLTVKMSDGSVGTIVYATRGDKAFSRERVEIFGRASACVIDNFRAATMMCGSKRKSLRRWSVDRGHAALLQHWVHACLHPEQFPLRDSLASAVATTAATLAAVESLRLRQPMEVSLETLWTAAVEARSSADGKG
jgi:predicted dehydrogenase/threonine dehydrogenase-like Zn-dependent dehydrogenase